jgi:hypothetical protein
MPVYVKVNFAPLDTCHTGFDCHRFFSPLYDFAFKDTIIVADRPAGKLLALFKSPHGSPPFLN